jgi:hypothetical protein
MHLAPVSADDHAFFHHLCVVYVHSQANGICSLASGVVRGNCLCRQICIFEKALALGHPTNSTASKAARLSTIANHYGSARSRTQPG